jgi:hypothetical protein
MPLYDRDWLDHQPDLTPAELAALFRLSSSTVTDQVHHVSRGQHGRRVLAHTLQISNTADSRSTPRSPSSPDTNAAGRHAQSGGTAPKEKQ